MVYWSTRETKKRTSHSFKFTQTKLQSSKIFIERSRIRLIPATLGAHTNEPANNAYDRASLVLHPAKPKKFTQWKENQATVVIPSFSSAVLLTADLKSESPLLSAKKNSNKTPEGIWHEPQKVIGGVEPSVRGFETKTAAELAVPTNGSVHNQINSSRFRQWIRTDILSPCRLHNFSFLPFIKEIIIKCDLKLNVIK